MYDEEGEQVWERSLDLNGKVINGSNAPCPFLYQGQYYDKEIELAYNRFRYYDPDDGRYISKDPIGLASGNPNFYAYVHDVNSWIDVFGLNASPESAKVWEHRFNNLPPSEKFNAAQGKLHKVAQKNGWEQNSKLSKANKRVVYQDPDKKLYSFDTQHGRFEYLDKKGNHLGEFDIDGNKTKIADSSGKHNIKCG
ncbi:RHS repeat-associated core domain-containing protein [Tenacibaculum maritimum]|uniref:RHS repeat-associated core domain-containing protein n=2 Tax=Tenacibaculum maritimum TaxID=107401 RepID=UPI00387749F1